MHCPRWESTRKEIPPGVSLEIIHKPSIKPSLELESIFILADLKMAELEAKKLAKKQKLDKKSSTPGAADCEAGAAVVSSGTEVGMQDAIGSSSSELPVAEVEQPAPEAFAVMVIVVAPSWA